MILLAIGKSQSPLALNWLIISETSANYKDIKVYICVEAIFLHDDRVLIGHIFKFGLHECNLGVGLCHLVERVKNSINKFRVHSGLDVGADMFKVLVLVDHSHVIVVPDLLGEGKPCIREAHNDKGFSF